MMNSRRELFIFFVILLAVIALALAGSNGQPWSVANAQGGTVPPGGGGGGPQQPPPEGFPCLDALAFHSIRDGNLEIYIMNGDGSGLSRLTFINPVDEHPAPSPDGRFIAFDSTRDQANNQIYVMNVDGTNVRRLTFSNAIDRAPNWSLDGQRIAFESNRDGSFQIWTMNFDGSDVRQLTKGAENDHPSWSKDNTRIAFVSNRDGKEEIYVMSASDGSNQTRLTVTPGSGVSGHATWSRNSQRIAFESNRTGNYEIFSMGADGSDVRQLTNTPAKQNRHPYWIPSCDDRITFSSNRDDPDFRIWVMNPDGSGQRRLRYERPGLLVNVNAPDDMSAWSGAPILPLNNQPPASGTATVTATRVSQLQPKPGSTPEPSVAQIQPQDAASATSSSNTGAVATTDNGFWGWLTSLWAWLTGK